MLLRENLMSAQVEGTVKWFNDDKGFGFIEHPDGSEVFVHYSVIIGDGRRTLIEGKRSLWKIIQTDKGPQADNVSPIDGD